MVIVEPVDETLFNCWLYVKQVFPSLPTTAEVRKNLTNTPAGVAVFSYNGTPHYAIVTTVGTSTFDISETNFKRGTHTKRTLSLNDKALLGFYLPIIGSTP